ncbi:hypothetical protein ABRY23_07365 [Melioribacteraceae bacterium 4301-Me]|uniref:hypothetical protein n=1 Tax=Pyranulibacter aquaticus TaxID=3163344 RepID=UPI00359610CF
MKSNQKIMLSFKSKIKDDGSIILPFDKLSELRKSNVKEIKVDIYAVPTIDKAEQKIISKIKKLQSLPENIIFDFLKSKGRLPNKFKKKVKF